MSSQQQLSFRSRQERLAELKQERDLYQKAIKNEPRWSSADSVQSRQSVTADAGSFQNLEALARHPVVENRDTLQYRGLPDTSDCVSQIHSTLKSKLKVKDGKQVFVDTLPDYEKTAAERDNHKAYSLKQEMAKEKTNKLQSKNQDPWSQFIAKEQRTRVKYYGNDKTLMVLLEEERIKYMQLETEYHKLLSEVQALQSNHLTELRQLEKKHEQEEKQYRQSLLQKTENSTMVGKELDQLRQQYRREKSEWVVKMEKMEHHITKLQALMAESDTQVAYQEKVISELNKSKKHAESLVREREGDLKRVQYLVREAENEALKERENRMKLEIQVLEYEHQVNEMQEQSTGFKTQLSRARHEIEELERYKHLYSESKKQAEFLSRREKQLMDELEQTVDKERKLYHQLQDTSDQCRTLSNDIERYQSQETFYKQELEHVKAVEAKLRQDLQSALAKLSQQSEEMNQTAKQARQQSLDVIRLGEQLAERQVQLDESRLQVQSTESQVQRLRQQETQLRTEAEELVLQRSQLIQELKTKDQELQHVQTQALDLSKKLEAEMKSKTEIKMQAKETALELQSQVNEIQQQAKLAVNKLQEYEVEMNSVTTMLKQREEALNTLTNDHVQLKQQFKSLQALLSQETGEKEQLKAQKREEFMALETKFTQAKQAMDQEVTHLRQQLQQKTSFLTTLSEDHARLKMDLSEVASDKFRLEARLSELTANESSYIRQVKNLQDMLEQRDQDFSLLSLKNQSASDQIKRLEEEIYAYRQSSHQKDNDLNRLQLNINELSRKLKSQVDQLADSEAAASLKRSMHALDSKMPNFLASSNSFQGKQNSAFAIPLAKTPSDRFASS